jgi:alpha-beta hydrolase superfamily lysophospholipase
VSVADLEDHAGHFLQCMEPLRKESQVSWHPATGKRLTTHMRYRTQDRPIILCAHSLGGIIAKLVRILHLTRSCVFI